MLRLLRKQVPSTFWEKGACCRGNRPSHSLTTSCSALEQTAVLPFTSEGADSTLRPALAPLLPPDGLRGGSRLGTGGLRTRRIALNLCPYLLPRNPECPQLLKGTVGDMLGLEVVRLGALLESSHQTLLLQQCSVHWLQLGLTGRQAGETQPLGNEQVAHPHSAG